MDLLWLLVKGKYSNFDKPTPSSIESGQGTVDRRNGTQIRKDLLKKLQEK